MEGELSHEDFYSKHLVKERHEAFLQFLHEHMADKTEP